MSSLSKTTKAAIWLQFSLAQGAAEDTVMEGLSWIINGIDGGRIPWSDVLLTVQGDNNND